LRRLVNITLFDAGLEQENSRKNASQGTPITMLTHLLAIMAGGLVGFSLGLIGGGGSILATPLLLYVVGVADPRVADPHVAIGTGALAVAANALTNLVGHARAGHVHWPVAILFAGFGIIGAAFGSSLGKAFPGQQLLFYFALLMVAVGILMLRSQTARRGEAGKPRLDVASVLRIAVMALLVGTASGFFGIGGGFLIVPGLVFAARLSMLDAIGSSLVSVASFGITTALNYAVANMVAWSIAAEFIAGGVLGGWLGLRLAVYLARYRSALRWVFAAIIFAVAAYIAYRNRAAVGF
jgi:uncharacterized membrane protein YfcA